MTKCPRLGSALDSEAKATAAQMVAVTTDAIFFMPISFSVASSAAARAATVAAVCESRGEDQCPQRFMALAFAIRRTEASMLAMLNS